MKIKSLLLSGAVLMAAQTDAQTWVKDTVVMGTNYTDDVFYNLTTGTKTAVTNTNWDLAFSALPATDMMNNDHYGVGAWINEAPNSADGHAVSLYYLPGVSAAADFATVDGSDTAGATADLLHNSLETYGNGAFNANGTGHPDYGWGLYDQTSHNVAGDVVYIALRDGVAYKIWIEKYNSLPPTTWTMHIGKLDGSTPVQDVTLDITANYGNRLFAYYSFENGPLNREPNVHEWDINFTRYLDLVSQGPGPMALYPVTGVYSNPYALVAEARNVNADSVNWEDYEADFESTITAIGRDWKTTTFGGTPPAYELDTVTYFVQTDGDDVYQIEFTYATTGGGGGIIHFRKRMVAEDIITSVGNVPTVVSSLILVPNPAANNADVVVNSTEAGAAQVIVSDLTGKLVARYPVSMKNGLNAFRINTENMPTGMYIVTLTNGSWKAAQKLMVQH
jgi:hypothetical protein